MRLLVAVLIALACSGQSRIMRRNVPVPVASCGTESTNCQTTSGLNDNNENWYYTAGQFTASESATICSLALYLKKTGTVTGTYAVGIYSDSSDTPGSLIGSWSDEYNRNDVTTSYAWYTMTKASGGLGASLTNATKYWVVLRSSVCCQLDFYAQADSGCKTGTPSASRSDNGSTWSAGSTGRSHRFILYK